MMITGFEVHGSYRCSVSKAVHAHPGRLDPADPVGLHDLLAIHHRRMAAVPALAEERRGDDRYYTVGIFTPHPFRKTSCRSTTRCSAWPTWPCWPSSRR
jgi:hypothetical protein